MKILQKADKLIEVAKNKSSTIKPYTIYNTSLVLCKTKNMD